MPKEDRPLLADVTEEAIALLIERFYATVRQEPLLGPVFESAIAVEAWPEHQATMRRFWSSVMLASGRYSGNPVAVHRAVPNLERAMFARWLALFEETARTLFVPHVADEFMAKAHRIAVSLQLALYHRPARPPEGLVLPPRNSAAVPEHGRS
ncbi:MAG TPA: group III truncated hemoglobin [Rhodopila sp.]